MDKMDAIKWLLNHCEKLGADEFKAELKERGLVHLDDVVKGKFVCGGEKRTGCPRVHTMHPCAINKPNDECYSRPATIRDLIGRKDG